MELLSRIMERWDYLYVENPLPGYYPRTCQYKNAGKKIRNGANGRLKKIHAVVLSVPMEDSLRAIYECYKKAIQGMSYRKRMNFLFNDKNILFKQPESLYDSYIFFMYSNGFAQTYREIYHTYFQYMSDPKTFHNFAKAYLKSDKIKDLDWRPTGEEDDLTEYKEFCYDLGKYSALLYIEAETMSDLVIYNKYAKSLEKKDNQVNKQTEHFDQSTFNSLEYKDEKESDETIDVAQEKIEKSQEIGPMDFVRGREAA